MSLVELFWGGGYMMWPLLFIGLAVLAVTIRAVLRVRSASSSEDVDRGLMAILFWGGIAPVLGLLGTVIGFMQIGVAIQAAAPAEVHPASMWGGITVALITLGFGLLLFIIAITCWYAVRAFAQRAAAI